MTVTPLDPARAEEVRSLVTMMNEVLARTVAAYEQAGVSLPDRRYWTLGLPAWDCEQLVVSFVQAYYGPPGDEASEPTRCDGPRTAALTVQVVRCIPSIGPTRRSPPMAADIQQASESFAIDAWLLLDVVRDLDSWDPLGGPGLGVIATVDANDAQGGFQGVTLNVSLAIP